MNARAVAQQADHTPYPAAPRRRPHLRLAPPPPSLRDQRILELHGLVRSIAIRMARRFPDHVDLDELINTGTLGLIDAVDRFDDTRGASLRSYAEIRIRGAIVDGMRQADWVPRTVRQRNARIELTRTELSRRLGRDPEDSEVADAMSMDLAEFRQAQDQARIRNVVSLDVASGPDSEELLGDRLAGDGPNAEDHWLGMETRQAVRDAIEDLPQREQIVLTLFYFRGRTLREIGQTLGVSESRACQLRAAGVRRLQSKLRSSMP